MLSKPAPPIAAFVKAPDKAEKAVIPAKTTNSTNRRITPNGVLIASITDMFQVPPKNRRVLGAVLKEIKKGM